MATLALAVVGSAVGSAVLPAGVSAFGVTLSGAAIGAQVGAFAGSYVDQALFGSSGQTKPVEGPRLRELHLMGSTEGEAIPRLYGRARLGGQVIWAGDIEERVIKKTSGGGGSGKGGGSSSGQASTTTIEYRYFANFAVALCEGPISGIGRVWADGQRINISRLTYRLYKGKETQTADSLILANLGASDAPAFRGTAYVVFEDMPLRRFGNRLPQLSFEVYRTVEPFGEEIKGIVVIPGSGEFVYATEPVSSDLGLGRFKTVNVHTRQAETDWAASIDQLEATLPNAKSASLIVSWIGDDLRAGSCQLKPGVELASNVTTPLTWSVAGLDRSEAHVVSLKDGRPAYGGTPSDDVVVQAIQDLTSRGFETVYTPFILMDVPDGNTLTNPYDGSGSQPVYPWRGRITVTPAPGQPGSPDQTPAAATQLASFIGTAQPSDFSISGTSVIYSGPDEWSYRRMVLHQAYLAKAAGGVTAFLIGTELRGLTWVRDGAGSYPFVAALEVLASDVKSVLGASTKVTYAADWSEYFGHQPTDGSGDVYFHLDPLWASSSIDAIGIDLYWSLADWRDGTSHLDYLAGARSTYDLAYLGANVAGGEGFDWYYASSADRDAQIRTPITDGSGKPWVFRFKDIKSWWKNQHFNRPGGVESATPTAWVPESKPFWIMEVGCPAADRGANQPNVFVDPKSSETALPYYSRGTRDDLIQRRYLRALIQAFDPASTGYLAGANPTSSVTSERMVDLSRIHVYCWDARPFPEFPYNADVWGDADNWRLGHWLNGRFASGPLAETVSRILEDYGFLDFEAGALNGSVPGYVIDRVMPVRDALQPLELAYFFDSIESGGQIVFRPRGGEPPVATYAEDSLVEDKPESALLTLTRGQETELPASAKIAHISGDGDYQQAVAEARRLTGASGRTSLADLPIVLEAERAREVAESWLFETWSARERAHFALPPSALALEPGDSLVLDTNAGDRQVRITEINDFGARGIEARALDPDVYTAISAAARRRPSLDSPVAGKPLVEFLDLPLLRGDEPVEAGYVAALQTPWPGGVAVYGSPETTGYVLKALVAAPAIMGETLDDLDIGPTAVMDRAARVQVLVDGGGLVSVSRLQLLSGQNIAALQNPEGEWEIIQFETATLTAPSTYELSGLIRGLAGSELQMRSPLAAGARFVLLTEDVARVDLTSSEVGLALNWRVGPASRDIGDASYEDRQHTFAGVGMKPFAPVHVRGVRDAGDLTITWVRRSRAGGDNWDSVEVPLGEASEAYEVDILDGSVVKRTLSVTAPTATYTQADQVADFGSAQASYTINVYQFGDVYGRGSAAAAVV